MLIMHSKPIRPWMKKWKLNENFVHQGLLTDIELLQGYIQWRDQIPISSLKLESSHWVHLLSPQMLQQAGRLLNRLVPPSSWSPIQHQNKKRKTNACTCILTIVALNVRSCAYGWADSQASVITVIRLGISGCSIGSCMESPTSNQEQVLYSKENSSKK